MKLFILGLRRSGTTITWETFRQDPLLLCYNEPFNPVIHQLPEYNPLNTYTEYARLIDRNAEEFWGYFAPIPRDEELRPELTDRQAAYLKYLLSTAEHQAFDLTRCHFKLDAIHSLVPEAVIIHLYRKPASHASSHLLPSRRDFRGRIQRFFLRRSFWSRRGTYNFWGIEEIVGSSPTGTFARHLTELGLDPERVYAMPAVGKVLAYWKVNYERVEKDGRRLFGERFLSVPFETFCSAPESIVNEVYTLAHLSPPDLDYTRIHPPNAGHLPDDPRWERYRDAIGLSADAIR